MLLALAVWCGLLAARFGSGREAVGTGGHFRGAGPDRTVARLAEQMNVHRLSCFYSCSFVFIRGPNRF
jgi:hypothetical protein